MKTVEASYDEHVFAAGWRSPGGAGEHLMDAEMTTDSSRKENSL